jgi:benzoyl-CoA 2,3-epoxidase subunit A
MLTISRALLTHPRILILDEATEGLAPLIARDFGPLTGLPKDFIDSNLAFSRAPNRPKRYVQDLLRERADDVATLLEDTNTHIYVCGLKGMEDGVMQALNDVTAKHGGAWEPLWQQFKAEGRFHVETY